MPRADQLPRTLVAPVLAVLAGAVLAAGSGSAGAGTPSPDDIRRSQADARQLQQQAQSQTSRLAGQQGRLAALAAAANTALDDFQQAREQQAAAADRLQLARARLAAARSAVAASREALDRYAALAYQNGGVETSLGPLHALLDARANDFPVALQYLGFAGQGQGEAVTTMQRTEAAERRAAGAARDTAAQTRSAALRAAAAKRTADVLVAQQRALVASLDAQLRTTRRSAAEAARQAAALARARRVALERARRAAAAQRAAGSSPVPAYTSSCAGGSLGGYPNGQLPAAALCPLWGAPGQLLRADAAAAFSRMSMAYAGQFGAPICVTDSYRPYAVQVQLYRDKPALAAFPGTSEHGWGRATDLCGGVQNSGTATHTWMVTNAPRFGWFHPGWAEPGGSRPEPWHFEYGG